MQKSPSKIILKTIAGILLALLTWALIYLIAHAGLYLLDMVRGLGDDLMQTVFREWVTPGVGGYAAIHAVNEFLKGANLKWVGIIFCSPLVIFYIGLSLYLMVFHSSRYEFSVGEQIIQWGVAITSCIGAYIAYRGIKGNT